MIEDRNCPQCGFETSLMWEDSLVRTCKRCMWLGTFCADTAAFYADEIAAEKSAGLWDEPAVAVVQPKQTKFKGIDWDAVLGVVE